MDQTMRTAFFLMAHFGGAVIELEKVAPILFGLGAAEAKRKAALNRLPVPAFRGGNQRSPWLVSVTDLAEFVDRQRQQARDEWVKSQVPLGVAETERRAPFSA